MKDNDNNLKDSLDFLLKPLGLKAEKITIFKGWSSMTKIAKVVVKDTSIGHIVDFDTDPLHSRIAVFDSYENLENELLTRISCFRGPIGLDSRQDICNPYLGSKSLEEAMIRRDLLDVQEV